MATEFLSRLLRLAAPPLSPYPPPHAGGAPALLTQFTAPAAALYHADGRWRPETPRLRVEIMAMGPFERLCGVRTAVNRLQADLVGAIRDSVIELRLTEVRRTCRHVTAWSRSPADPGAGTTEWECLEEPPGTAPENRRTLLTQAFRDSVRNGINHVVLFGDRFDDGLIQLTAAVLAFRARGIRVSAFCIGGDFNTRHRYRFLAAATGGLFLALSGRHCRSDAVLESVLPVVAAFASGDHPRLAVLPASTPEAKALMKQVRGR